MSLNWTEKNILQEVYQEGKKNVEINISSRYPKKNQFVFATSGLAYIMHMDILMKKKVKQSKVKKVLLKISKSSPRPACDFMISVSKFKKIVIFQYANSNFRAVFP